MKSHTLVHICVHFINNKLIALIFHDKMSAWAVCSTQWQLLLSTTYRCSEWTMINVTCSQNLLVDQSQDCDKVRSVQ